MTKSSNIFKKLLLVLVFVLLFFPIIQSNLNLFLINDLKGFFNKAPDLKFSSEEWLDISFQEKKERFLNDNFGFRESLVRMNNQFRFSLFKKSSSAEAVVGKEGYFFGDTYLRSYLGEDFVGVDSIINKCILVKELQQRLEQRGQIFLPVLGPNKIRVLSSYIPDDVHKKSISNYEVFKAMFDKLKIRYIDFNDYFCKANSRSKYPLYSKYGTHWNHYGHTYAVDSIIKYLNYNYKLNVPTLIWDSVMLSNTLHYPDNDIVDGMNLMVDQFPSEPMPYPKVSFSKAQSNNPSLFVVGDSYNNGLIETDYQNQAFSNYVFLYYFKEVHPFTNDKYALYKLNLKQEIDSHKVILLVTGEFNMTEYGWGFIEKAIGLLKGKIQADDLEFENMMFMVKDEILNDKQWIAKIKEQSEKENINFDSLLTRNAHYLVELKILKGNSNKNLRVKLLKEKIRYNSGWMKEIVVKAKQRNISVDSMVTVDAFYVLDQAR